MVKIADARNIAQGPSLRDPGVRVPDVGAGAGQALAQVGGQLSAIAERRERVRQTVDRVEKTARAREMAFEAFTDWEKTSDVTDEASAESFIKALDGQFNQILKEHKGDEQSAAQLQARLTDLRIDYVYKASTTSTLARREKVLNSVNGQVSEQAGQAFAAPETLDEQLSSVQETIDDLSGGLSTTVVNELKNRSNATLVRSALDGALARGDFETANSILSDTSPYAQALPPDQVRQYRARAIKAASEVDDQTSFQKNVKFLESRFGRALTPTELGSMKGLGSEVNAIEQRIRAYETRMGRAATPEEVDQFFDVERPDEEVATPFGTGARGRSMQRVSEQAEAFAAGQTTPQQDRLFLGAASFLLQPERDPVTGAMRPAVVPPFLMTALQERGYTINREGTQIVTLEGAPTPVGSDSPPDLTPEQRRGAENTTAPQVESLASGDLASAANIDLFGNAENIAGIPAGVGATLAATPIIGDLLVDAPEMTQGRLMATLVRDNIARALQQSPRFASMELSAIKKELGDFAKTFTTVESFRQELIALDTQLMRLEEEALQRGENPEMPAEERKRTRTLAQDISFARDALGIRQRRVETPEEAQALPSGTVFITPDNVVMVRD